MQPPKYKLLATTPGTCLFNTCMFKPSQCRPAHTMYVLEKCLGIVVAQKQKFLSRRAGLNSDCQCTLKYGHLVSPLVSYIRKHGGREGLDISIFQSSPDKANATRFEKHFCRCSPVGGIFKTVNTSVSKELSMEY